MTLRIVIDEALPGWMPLEGDRTVDGHIPSELFGEVVRVPVREEENGGVDPAWPEALQPGWAELALCDVIDRPIKFGGQPSDEQVRQLASVMLRDSAPFRCLVPDKGGGVANALRHGVVQRPRESRVRGRLSAAAIDRFGLPGSAVSAGGQASRYHLLAGEGERDAFDAVAAGDLEASHLWTDAWLLRCEEWREDYSMLLAGPSDTGRRLAANGVSSMIVQPSTPWSPLCRRPERHLHVADTDTV